jgi:DNA-binding transcriptional LysR family regulator
MNTMNEQAKKTVLALAEGSSISSVAKRLGIPQQTLSRFVTKPDAALSLRNFVKLLPYIPHQQASGE